MCARPWAYDWGEVARPGYGLFDRALGVSYLNGLWEAVEKSRRA